MSISSALNGGRARPVDAWPRSGPGDGRRRVIRRLTRRADGVGDVRLRHRTTTAWASATWIENGASLGTGISTPFDCPLIVYVPIHTTRAMPWNSPPASPADERR